MVISLVGGDGSGKSSAVRMLAEWLGDQLDVEVVHLGKPSRSIARRVLSKIHRMGGRPEWSRRLLDLSLGFDRARAARRAAIRARKGTIVITDRYPLAEMEAMDWKRLGPGGMLATVEDRIYQRIERPDKIVVLRVTPETAVSRRTEQDADFVADRAEAVQSMDWTASGATVIDADQHLERVHSQIKRTVWSDL